MMTRPSLALTVLSEVLAVCRLEPASPIPGWALAGGLWSLTRTRDELSVVCEAGVVPTEVMAEGGWRAIMVAGPLDFALVGVLLAVAAPLADAGVSIFAVSTYDTDYVLVRAEALEMAVAALLDAGHTVQLPG